MIYDWSGVRWEIGLGKEVKQVFVLNDDWKDPKNQLVGRIYLRLVEAMNGEFASLSSF